jgi:hypothetical protein
VSISHFGTSGREPAALLCNGRACKPLALIGSTRTRAFRAHKDIAQVNGTPKEDAIKYENAITSDRFLVIAHGASQPSKRVDGLPLW